jgi:hypothetical protein
MSEANTIKHGDALGVCAYTQNEELVATSTLGTTLWLGYMPAFSQGRLQCSFSAAMTGQARFAAFLESFIDSLMWLSVIAALKECLTASSF